MSKNVLACCLFTLVWLPSEALSEGYCEAPVTEPGIAISILSDWQDESVLLVERLEFAGVETGTLTLTIGHTTGAAPDKVLSRTTILESQQIVDLPLDAETLHAARQAGLPIAISLAATAYRADGSRIDGVARLGFWIAYIDDGWRRFANRASACDSLGIDDVQLLYTKSVPDHFVHIDDPSDDEVHQ